MDFKAIALKLGLPETATEKKSFPQSKCCWVIKLPTNS